MLVFTLAVSYLVTSNLSWFMDLTFQVPVQCCSLQHRTTFTMRHTCSRRCFSLGLASALLLGLYPCSSPAVCCASTDLGRLFCVISFCVHACMSYLFFCVIAFCLFIVFVGFSRQEYWSGLPFPSPVEHVLSELSTVTCLSGVAVPVIAHSFIELDKAVIHLISLVSFLWSLILQIGNMNWCLLN